MRDITRPVWNKESGLAELPEATKAFIDSLIIDEDEGEKVEVVRTSSVDGDIWSDAREIRSQSDSTTNAGEAQ